jgi:N4-gp56 family major capsid protein
MTVGTGTISARKTAYVDRLLLKRAMPYNVFGRYGQSRVLPKSNSKQITFRRYESMPPVTTPFAEGVRPTAGSMTGTDVSLTLQQYGYWVPISDVALDTNEDQLITEAAELLGEQAGESIDVLRFDVLKAGTSVYYANGSARTSVNTVAAAADLHKIERFLRDQKARMITERIPGGPGTGTVPIASGYRAICHPDCIYDLRQITGFIDVKDYPNHKNVPENEFGSWGIFRFEDSTNATAWADGGGTAGNMKSTSGSAADVYPILFFARDAYAVVNFAGQNAVKTYITQPGGHGDELHQVGAVGWKAMTGAIILNDNYMCRLECAVTADANLS